jgi:hypothetical protein
MTSNFDPFFCVVSSCEYKNISYCQENEENIVVEINLKMIVSHGDGKKGRKNLIIGKNDISFFPACNFLSVFIRVILCLTSLVNRL